MKNKNIIICFGKRAVFSRILAAIIFGIGVYILVLFFINKPFIFSEKYVISILHLLKMEIFIFAFALPFSLSKAHHFNFAEMKYREYFFVGPIGYGFWRKFKKLNRVSTFLNSREECEVNIWDIRNNRYKIAVFDKIEDAVFYGRDLAEKLKINFKERN